MEQTKRNDDVGVEIVVDNDLMVASLAQSNAKQIFYRGVEKKSRLGGPKGKNV